eukprot:TRINITY_DN11570_c0_g1_i5.p1 TRINITY_DN11570_c0_g1~~TRINITY_DN11570_c0_g1_i5.p1  ORF type:complete len:744 (-),score=97.96 TRINITY_DN11570_c0_g1_i5:85-2205(-)
MAFLSQMAPMGALMLALLVGGKAADTADQCAEDRPFSGSDSLLQTWYESVETSTQDCFQPKTKYTPVNCCGQGRSVAASAAECQQRCASVSGCAHFSWWPDGGCHLQDSDASPAHAVIVTAGPPICKGEVTTTTTTTTSTPCYLKNAKYVPVNCCGQGRSVAASAAECQQRCASVSGCCHFSWWPDGGCHIQDSKASPSSTPHAKAGPPICNANATQAYKPGTSGGAWTQTQMAAIRAKLIRLIEDGDAVTREGKISVPGERWAGLPTGAKLLRLSFHDCLKYRDGSGGCDGCLEWTGVGERFGRREHGKFLIDDAKVDDGHNNGLQPTVEVLEKIYTDPSFPLRTQVLERSLQASGISRADLWAFAAMVSVEYSIGLNNRACDKDLRDGAGLFGQCHPRLGEADCKVTAPRPFIFKHGRKDCLPDTSLSKPYMTSKKESHPNPTANGEAALKFFKQDFGFNAKEVVAIMGAHTLGRVHNTISLNQYTWKTRSGMLFNNGYYRNMVLKEDWYYPSNDRRTCRGVGTSSGARPQARWVPHAFLHTKKGLPVQWLQEKKVCPCFDKPKVGCCAGSDGFSCKAGCEKWRIVLGIDETMLNSDMGLYLNFSTQDGVPTGCSGLSNFNLEAWKKDWRFSSPHNPPGKPDGPTPNIVCPKNMIQDPPNSPPMSQIVEGYADDNARWLADFYPALEKMLQNGYGSLNGGLAIS